MAKIISCKYLGKQQTYDLEVGHHEHQFYLANGLLTSNSHAISYSYNSYHCAWLYTYHEKAWIQACLERDPDLQETLSAVRGLGYDVEKPDVNFSGVDEWVVKEDKTCIPSLTSLKGLGLAGGQELVKNRPPGGFKTLQEFFYDEGEWRYSKLNKKCLTALMRLEAFRGIPDAVGPQEVFKNHAHMERAIYGKVDRPSKAKKGALVTYENQILLKKNKITFDEIALEADSDDWTVPEKIEQQKTLVGFYDKGLIVNEYLPMFQEFGISAIDEIEDEQNKHNVWATIDKVEQKRAASGNPFVKVSASGITAKPYSFRVWKTVADKSLYWVSGNIIVFSLQYQDEWGYSVPARSKITKVEK